MKTLGSGKTRLHVCPYCGGRAFLSHFDIKNKPSEIEHEMWDFIKTGKYDWTWEDTQTLKNLSNMCCNMLVQKTAGQEPYAHEEDVSFDHFQALMYRVAMQAIALSLSDAIKAI